MFVLYMLPGFVVLGPVGGPTGASGGDARPPRRHRRDGVLVEPRHHGGYPYASRPRVGCNVCCLSLRGRRGGRARPGFRAFRGQQRVHGTLWAPRGRSLPIYACSRMQQYGVRTIPYHTCKAIESLSF